MNFPLPPVDSTVLNSLNSPSLLVFADRVRDNIDLMIRIAGSVDRLRPHCKTHKMSAVVRMLLEKGMTRHKAATIAEAEMLAEADVRDIVLAYNIVGPNIGRVTTFLTMFPDVRLAVTADHPTPVAELSAAVTAAGCHSVGVMLDVDVGLHRTGVNPQHPNAVSIYQAISDASGLVPAGFHVYDGHQHQHSAEERRQAVLAEWPKVVDLKQRCEAAGLKVPELLCGGTPTFPIYAALTEPEIMLSPGTCIFQDVGYGDSFRDLSFQPAVVAITRVISRPTKDRLTLDLGNKAVASDPPKGRRVWFPDLPDAAQVIHNEEHLVLETDQADRFQPGDILLGIPTHICPTSALHQDVAVLDGGKLTGFWEVTARNRRLTI
ncbi:MAG: D-TA family PLP-dependent enzyme [Planctomycetaceae bacterium]|nr:D-TA family PLP-dependent enzyme [Planctomycetaceae bacterium]